MRERVWCKCNHLTKAHTTLYPHQAGPCNTETPSVKCAHTAHARVRENLELRPAITPPYPLYDSPRHKYEQTVYSRQCILLTGSSEWVRHTRSPKPSSEWAMVNYNWSVSVGLRHQGSFVRLFQGRSWYQVNGPWCFSSLSAPGPAHCHACPRSDTQGLPHSMQLEWDSILAMHLVIVSACSPAGFLMLSP